MAEDERKERIVEALADYIKTEKINGAVYDMSPANTKHIIIQGNLSRIIGNFLRGKQCKVFSEIGVHFDDDNYFIPDVTVVCDRSKITEQGIKGTPDFVAEVLSFSTHRKDITVKKQVYEKFGVKEYWIISPKDETIEVYLWQNGKYELGGVYHNATEEDMKYMTDREKAEINLSLKLSLYDDLEIQVKDIFEM